MAKSITATSSGGATTGLLIYKMELVPDGGSVQIRLYTGTDQTGIERYRMLATENAEVRDFSPPLQIPGPVYLYFYSGTGAITFVTEEDLASIVT